MKQKVKRCLMLRSRIRLMHQQTKLERLHHSHKSTLKSKSPPRRSADSPKSQRMRTKLLSYPAQNKGSSMTGPHLRDLLTQVPAETNKSAQMSSLSNLAPMSLTKLSKLLRL